MEEFEHPLCPPPHPDSKRQLELGKARVELVRAQTERVEAEYAATPEGQAEIQRKEEAERIDKLVYQQNKQFFDNLYAVTID